ncbi:ATP-binding protein [Desulfobacula phenolica]|uniref:Sensory/regulatory protein RpfC n=1 Tax=Desulfobacula phenolica TaxID=90732 RepID=A0A1H2JAM3_9BACT|nr:ATP-binding protein [Desulfobacula phenolica]SDU53098.1 Type IV pili methyl-accepting chemotaxis transducer N-term [Desulfobacula phenolica]
MNKSDFIKKKRKKKLSLRYMTAIGLIAFLSLLSLIMVCFVLDQQEDFASLINISGRQRMLSQQTTLIAHEILTSHEKEIIEKKKEQLLSAINLMEDSHEILISGRLKNGKVIELSDTLSRMYFQEPLKVDERVKKHINTLKELLQYPVLKNSEQNFRMFSEKVIEELLDSLNQVVFQYELESDYYTAILKKIAVYIFISTVILLTLIVIFGFRPMINNVVENERLLRNILDNIPVYMDIATMQGIILYQSKFLIDFMGKNTYGQKCFLIYRDNRQPCPGCPIFNGLTENGISTVHSSDCFNGKTFIITHVKISYMGKSAMLKLFQDITELKRTEKLLIKAKMEAEYASAMKSVFIANMSHEIRTPMNTITGLTELALQTELSPVQTDYLTRIKSSTSLLLGIINEILDFSKIEAGKLHIETVDFCLADLISNISDIFSSKVSDKGIYLDFDLDSRLPEALQCDPNRLNQILTNLVSNAVKFTEKGGIRLSLERLDQNLCSARVKFTVTDSGIGIEKNILDKIFNSFTQTDITMTRKYSGIGLGLSLCQQLVRLMGGCLMVESIPGKGSSFFFTLDMPVGDKTKAISSINFSGYNIMAVPSNEPTRIRSGQIIQANDDEENAILKNIRISLMDGDIAANLAKLDKLLQNNDFQALSEFTELKPMFKAAGLSHETEGLEKDINLFKYRQAREKLADIRQMLIFSDKQPNNE